MGGKRKRDDDDNSDGNDRNSDDDCGFPDSDASQLSNSVESDDPLSDSSSDAIEDRCANCGHYGKDVMVTCFQCQTQNPLCKTCRDPGSGLCPIHQNQQQPEETGQQKCAWCNKRSNDLQESLTCSNKPTHMFCNSCFDRFVSDEYPCLLDFGK